MNIFQERCIASTAPACPEKDIQQIEPCIRFGFVALAFAPFLGSTGQLVMIGGCGRAVVAPGRDDHGCVAAGGGDGGACTGECIGLTGPASALALELGKLRPKCQGDRRRSRALAGYRTGRDVEVIAHHLVGKCHIVIRAPGGAGGLQ